MSEFKESKPKVAKQQTKENHQQGSEMNGQAGFYGTDMLQGGSGLGQTGLYGSDILQGGVTNDTTGLYNMEPLTEREENTTEQNATASLNQKYLSAQEITAIEPGADRKEYNGSDIPENSMDSGKFDTYFNKNGTVNKVVSGGTGLAFLVDHDNAGREAIIQLKLSNKEVLDRAHWVFGEGGGFKTETYAGAIENLKMSGPSGYGVKPYSSEEAMYQSAMSHQITTKNKATKQWEKKIIYMYPDYFTGQYQSQNPMAFAVARKNYAALMANNDMVASIQAVLSSISGQTKITYNSWRGGAGQIYHKSDIDKWPSTDKPRAIGLKNGKPQKGVPVVYLNTHTDHFFQDLGGGRYYRHTFITVSKISKDRYDEIIKKNAEIDAERQKERLAKAKAKTK